MCNYIINGLQEASAHTFDMPVNSGLSVQISYNRITGDVFTMEHASYNDYTVYNNNNIITICHTSKHIGPDRLKSMIIETLELLDQYK